MCKCKGNKIPTSNQQSKEARDTKQQTTTTKKAWDVQTEQKKMKGQS